MTPAEHLLHIEALLHRCRVRLAMSVGCTCGCLTFSGMSILLAVQHGKLIPLFAGLQVGLSVGSAYGAWRSYRWWKAVREIRRNTAIQFDPRAPVALRELADDQAEAAYAELKRLCR